MVSLIISFVLLILMTLIIITWDYFIRGGRDLAAPAPLQFLHSIHKLARHNSRFLLCWVVTEV